MNNPQKKNLWLKLIVGIVIFIVADFILIKYTPVGSWLKSENLQMLKQQAGIFAPLGYILIYFFVTLLALPASILTLSAGALFGAFWGGLWTLIGATLGATGAFLVARFIAGDWARQQFEGGERLRQLSQGIEENGFWFALSLRLAPVFPFNAVNYLLGLTPISLPVYVLATAIGIIPGTFAYAWLGEGGLAAATGRPSWQLVGALAMLAVLSVLPIVWKRLKAKNNHQ